MTNTLLLSSNNKISNKKKLKNNNMINTEINKSETKNNLIGKKLKKNKFANKCISKEIIPFSMNNNINSNNNNNNNKNDNNNKVKSETKSDLNNLNSMINSPNNISSSKNFKIYENHIRDYPKTNNKNKEKDEKNNKDLSENISQIPKENLKLVNDKNINSSIESSFLGSIKSSIKKIDLNKVSKYFYFWYKKGFYIKIKNRLRSLSKFFKFCDKIKKNKIDYFLKKFKNYQNFVIFLQIKNFFCDNKVKIITKIIIKCYAHIIIRKYHEIVYKRKILRKLKEYLIKGHNKIKNEIQNDIKSIKNENKEKGHSISKKNIKFNNKNELIIQLPKNNLVLSATTNKSMLNLFNPIIPLDLNHKERIGYNFTEGKQSNKNVNYNIITKTLKLNLNKKKDTITQNNQLTMVINLVEHLRIKNIKKDPSLPGCFRKWKNNIVNNLTKKKFSGRINEPAVFTDTEDLPKKINLDDHYQSEPETGNKINIHNKYIPVRGVKYFHGKVKQNDSLANKNKKNKINNLIDNYKTTTIPTNNTFNTNTYNSNERIEVVYNKMNMNLNDNFRTFNDCKTLEYNNNIIINNSNNYLKIKNLIQKAKILLPSKNQNSNCIYHRKALGVSLKNNINNNYNTYNNNINTNSNTKNKNYQYTNDSINTTLDNNYGANFLTLINNASFLENYKIKPLMLFKNENEYNKDYANSNGNCNLLFNKNGKFNENIHAKNLFGFKKLNKIEEKEICFFPNKNNNINNINNLNNNKSNTIIYKNSHYNNRYDDEDISLVSEMKKYYNENKYIRNNSENKKKFNSFIINIFNNTIIMIQKTKHKRSNSK